MKRIFSITFFVLLAVAAAAQGGKKTVKVQGGASGIGTSQWKDTIAGSAITHTGVVYNNGALNLKGGKGLFSFYEYTGYNGLEYESKDIADAFGTARFGVNPEDGLYFRSLNDADQQTGSFYLQRSLGYTTLDYYSTDRADGFGNAHLRINPEEGFSYETANGSEVPTGYFRIQRNNGYSGIAYSAKDVGGDGFGSSSFSVNPEEGFFYQSYNDADQSRNVFSLIQGSGYGQLTYTAYSNSGTYGNSILDINPQYGFHFIERDASDNDKGELWIGGNAGYTPFLFTSQDRSADHFGRISMVISPEEGFNYLQYNNDDTKSSYLRSGLYNFSWQVDNNKIIDLQNQEEYDGGSIYSTKISTKDQGSFIQFGNYSSSSDGYLYIKTDGGSSFVGSSVSLGMNPEEGFYVVNYGLGYNFGINNGGMSTNRRMSAESFKVNLLNTAPSSSSDTGTQGDIRITSSGIYICTATNTWIKCTATTF